MLFGSSCVCLAARCEFRDPVFLQLALQCMSWSWAWESPQSVLLRTTSDVSQS